MPISQHTGLLVGTLVVGLTWSAPAMGESVQAKFDYGHVSGTATVHRNQVKWDLRINDPKPNNRGVYAYIEMDREGRPDERIFYSRITVGGQTQTFLGSKRGDSHTQGARVYLCEAKRKVPQSGSDECREVAYIPER
jgi:hypothetical protein